jgi:hypothetical protein
MRLLSIQELESLKNRCEEIRKDDNTDIELPNQKWIEKRMITFEEDGRRMYVAYYDILDKFIDQCYYGEGYISDNYERINDYYNTIGE